MNPSPAPLPHQTPPVEAFLQDVKQARRLVGLSGASVFLATRDDKAWFVRKVATSPGASVRLRGQAERQRRLSAMVAPVRTPIVLDDGEVDGCYWFDMERVRGVDAATYLARASLAEVAAFTENLVRWLYFAQQQPPLLSATSTLAFGHAVAERVASAMAKSAAPEALTSTVQRAMAQVAALELPAQLCHGDLTLENMIVTADGVVYLIDVLDPPFDHWALDVAKLHQDLEGGWYRRHQARLSWGVLSHVSTHVLRAAATLWSGYPQVHTALLCATFARILPYTTSDAQRHFVEARVAHFAAQAVAGDVAMTRT